MAVRRDEIQVFTKLTSLALETENLKEKDRCIKELHQKFVQNIKRGREKTKSRRDHFLSD